MSTDNEKWDPPAPPESTKKWPQHPKGACRFVLADAIRMGEKADRKWGKVKDIVALIYQSEKIEPVWDEQKNVWVPQTTGERFQLSTEMTYGATEKSLLPKWFANWLDLPADTDEQRARLVSEIPSYIGRCGLGTVKHNVDGDRTYVNLVAMAPLPDGMAPLEVLNYQRRPNWAKKKARYAEEVAAFRKEQTAAAAPKPPTDFSDVPPAVADDETDLPF